MGKKRSKNLARVDFLKLAKKDVEAEVLEKSDEANELDQRIRVIEKKGGNEKKPSAAVCSSSLDPDEELVERKGYRRRSPGVDLPLPEMEENLLVE